MRNKDKFEDNLTRFDSSLKNVKAKVYRNRPSQELESDVEMLEKIYDRLVQLIEMEDYSVGNSF